MTKILIKGKFSRAYPTGNGRIYSSVIMVRECEELKKSMPHDVEMLALAEALMTEEEILAILNPLGVEAFRAAKRAHQTISSIRFSIKTRLNSHCEEHFYVDFKQHRAIAAITRRLLKGYQRWWGRVERECKEIRRHSEKTGSTCPYLPLAATKKISPELFRGPAHEI